MKDFVDQLCLNKFRESTKKNYYGIWKSFNTFILRLDDMPQSWENHLILYIGFLIKEKRQSSMIKSYLSAIKAILGHIGMDISMNLYLLNSLTKACKLQNDKFRL